MTKKERLEDLGIVREKLSNLIDHMEDTYIEYFDSKHSYDDFKHYMTKNDNENLYDLHVFLRQHLEKLCEIFHISDGDTEQ